MKECGGRNLYNGQNFFVDILVHEPTFKDRTLWIDFLQGKVYPQSQQNDLGIKFAKHELIRIMTEASQCVFAHFRGKLYLFYIFLLEESKRLLDDTIQLNGTEKESCIRNRKP